MQDVKMAMDLLKQKHQCPHNYMASNYARVGTVQRGHVFEEVLMAGIKLLPSLAITFALKYVPGE